MEIFWLVVRYGTYNINKWHMTEAEATLEAERLCRKENDRFYVLKVTPVMFCEREKNPVLWTEM